MSEKKPPIRLSEERAKRLREKSGGIQCPHCLGKLFRVTHTRPGPYNTIRRRRVCSHCGKPVTTVEAPVTPKVNEEPDKERSRHAAEERPEARARMERS